MIGCRLVSGWKLFLVCEQKASSASVWGNGLLGCAQLRVCELKRIRGSWQNRAGRGSLPIFLSFFRFVGLDLYARYELGLKPRSSI